MDLTLLRRDPKFRALSVTEQLRIARTLLYRDFTATSERFRAESLDSKRVILDRLSASAVTFNNEGYGDYIRKLATEYASGGSGLGKGAYEFGAGVVKASGIASIISMIAGETKADRADRARALEYFRLTDQANRKGNPWAEIGGAVGFVGDIVAVNAAMGGATRAANASIQAASRGMTTAAYLDKADDLARGVKLAKDALSIAKRGKDAATIKAARSAYAAARAMTPGPILAAKLAAYGPIASESAIEAIPYFILEESRRYANGEESAISQGAGEVLKTLGVNAASDFIIGSFLTTLIRSGAHVLGNVLKRSDRYKDAFTNLEEKLSFLDRITSGPDDARLLAGLPEIDKDHVMLLKRAKDYVSGGVMNSDLYLEGRAASLANNELGRIWGKADDGTYYLYEVGSGSQLRKVTYTNFLDLENTLALEYVKKLQRSAALDAKAIAAGTPGYTATARVRPDLASIFQRGELLLTADNALTPANIHLSDPHLAKALQSKGRKYPKLTHRPFATASELDALESETTHVVRTQLDLGGDITRNVNERHLDLLRGKSGITVSISDTPNAAIVGVSEAPYSFYENALARADELSASGDAFGVPIPKDVALSGLMLDAGFDHVRLPDGSFRFFSTRTLKLLGNPDQIVEATKHLGDFSSQVTVKKFIEKSISAKSLAKNPEVVTSAALKAIRSGDPEDYTKFSRIYLQAYDSNASVGARRVSGTSLTVTRRGSHVTINVPERFINPLQEERAFKTLLQSLDEVGELTTGPKALKRVVNSAEAYELLKANKARFGFPVDVDSRPWIKSVTKYLGGEFIELPSGAFELRLPSGTHSFSNITDVQDFLARKSLDPAYLRKQLAQEGIRVIESENLVQFRDYQTGKILSSGTTFDEALSGFNWAPKKVSNRFGPDAIHFGNGTFTFTGEKNIVFKNWEKATAYLNKFEDTAEAMTRTAIRSTAEGTIYKSGNSVYELYSPRWGSWHKFENPNEAMTFLRKKVKPLDDLKAMADRKMLDVTIENNRFRVEAPDGTVHYANDQEALAKLYSRYPDCEKSVREVIDFLDPALVASVGDLAEQWRRSAPLAGMNKYGAPPTPLIEEGHHLSAALDALAPIAQKTDLIEMASAKNPEVLRLYRALQAAHNTARHEASLALKYLDGIFKDANGKHIPYESRQKIFYSLGRNTGEVAARLDAEYLNKFGKALEPLTPTEAKVATDLREFYAKLSDTMGIPYEKLISEYMPRIRDLRAEKSTGLLNSYVTAGDLLDAHWKGSAPPQLKAFFEHDRVSDLLEYPFKDDALEVAMLYTNQGYKTFYMNRAWQDMHAYISANKSNLDPVLVNAINQWREAVMGNKRSWSEKTIENFGRKLFTNIKKIPGIGRLIPYSPEEFANMGANLLPSMLGVTYVGSMGWKPFLAIRNTFQTWTLGARIGTDWIARAQKYIEDDYPGVVRRLRDLGILKDTAPIVNQVWGNTSKIGKFANASLEWFANSDDYSRALMYLASETRFRNAVDAFMQGRIVDQRSFLKLSGLSRTDALMQQELWAKVATRDGKKLEEATHLFSSKMTADAMFIYEAAESPELHKTALGKFWGQYGNYAAGYRAQLRRMFQHGDAEDKLEILTSFFGISLALWGTFTAFKIKTNDFIPVTPGIFTGGPLFDVAMDVMKLGGGGYEADQARARLKYSVPSLMPGSSQINYIKKAIEYSEKGDSYRAWLSLTSIPVIPE